MGTESIRDLDRYLRGIAPKFFSERMRGASEAKIVALEKAARTSLSDSHREFLRVMGATPATVLNPFLNDRDYCVETLLATYSRLDAEEASLPERLVYFSASTILGEAIFLRTGNQSDEEPEIGDIRPETGEFIPDKIGRFESWLRWFAFHFHISQFEHQIRFQPPWNGQESRWVGESSLVEQILTRLDLRPTFSRLEGGSLCLDRSDIAGMVHPDGSARLAGDDLRELREVAAVLTDNTRLVAAAVAEGDRLRAPRE